MDEDELIKVVSNIINLMEEYANGGLEYLQELYSNNKLTDSHYVFLDLFK